MRIFLLALPALAAALLIGCADTPPEPATAPVLTTNMRGIRLAVVGDRTGTAVLGIYSEVVAEVTARHPDLVLVIGDMIEGQTSDTTKIKKQWTEYKDMVKPLDLPVYYTPGNHDIWDQTSLEFYVRYIGPICRSFDAGDVHFAIVDNSRAMRIEDFPKSGIGWLENDLREHSDAKYTIVCMHVPYWMYTVAKGRADTLHTIFVHYGVDAVISGHTHQYAMGCFDGITYLNAGSSGAKCEPGEGGLQYLYIWATVDRQGIRIEPARIDYIHPWKQSYLGELDSRGELPSVEFPVFSLPG